MANYLILNFIFALFYGSVLILSPSIWREALTFQLLTSLYLIPSSWFLGTVISKSKDNNKYASIFLGYPALILFEAVFVYLLGVDWAWLPLILLAVSSIIYFALNNSFQIKRIEIIGAINGQFPFLAITFSAYLVFFICYISTLRLPTIEKPALYYQDLLWAVGNLWSIIRSGFPVESSRFSGQFFGYHFAPWLHQAACYSITHIKPLEMSLFLSPIFDLVMLCGGIYFGAIRILECGKRKAVFYCSILLFTALPSINNLNSLVEEIYYNPASMFFGLQSFVLIVFNLFRFSESTKIDPLYNLILMAVSLGSKGHLIVTFLPAVGIFYLFILFRTCIWPTRDHIAFIVGLIVLIFLLKISLYNVNSNQVFPREFKEGGSRIYDYVAATIGMENGGYVNLKYCFHLAKFAFIESLNNVFGNLFFVYSLGVFSLSLIFGFKIGNRKPVVFAICFFFFSILTISIFSFPGGEHYFRLYPLVVILLLFAYIPSGGLDFLTTVKKLVFGVGLILFISFLYKSTLLNKWWIYPNSSQPVWDESATISFDEREGLEWMKKNLKGSIIASDRYEFSEYKRIPGLAGRFFGYSAFSGLRFYNEGYSYDGTIFPETSLRRSNEIGQLVSLYGNPEFSSYMRAAPFDYFIISKRFNPVSEEFLNALDIVFQNLDFVVVKANGN